MSLLSLPKIQLQNVCIGKRDIVQSKISHFSVKYGDQQHDIVIHTPKLLFQTIPTPSKSNGFYQLTLCFYNYDCSQETRDFIDKCIQLEEWVFQQTKNRITPEQPAEPTFQPSIVFNPTKTKAYMFVSLKPDVSTIYDTKRQKQSPDYIIAQSSGYCILYLHSLWNHNSLKWGFNWTCLQAKVYHPYPTLQSYMIQDPDEETPDNHYREPSTTQQPSHPPILTPPTPEPTPASPVIDESHPTYGKFIKMKRVGLPEPVIRIKCQQEGYNWDDIMKLSQSSTSIPLPVSVPSPPPPPSISMGPPAGMGRGGPLFTSDMFSKVTLKKAEPAKPTVENSKKNVQHLKSLNNGFQPPSLHDIQNMLSKLRPRSSTTS